MDAGRSAGRLPGELTEFVGRRAELTRVRDALEGARLVTLTGPGGIGKTRLALRVASGAGRAFDDGVWLAELGGLRDPGLVVDEVASKHGDEHDTDKIRGTRGQDAYQVVDGTCRQVYW